MVGDFNTKPGLYENMSNINYNKTRRMDSFEEFLVTYNLTIRNSHNIKTFENKNWSNLIELIIMNARLNKHINQIKINKINH